MHITVIFKVIGLLLIIYSTTMIPPALVAVYYHDDGLFAFIASFFIALLSGLFFWFPIHKKRIELRTRDGFVIVVMFWVVLGFFGAAPFLLSQHPMMSFTDAVFESISGLTTTGATVLTGIDDLPKSILFYRQQLQWLGGMGIIVLAVAVLPMLGIGGMQLYRAETPGPVKDSKLTPRITETAKALWYIYVTLTTFCALSYWLAGMSVFDAICHAFSTIAIGGFSTHDASIGYYDNPTIEMVCIFYMVLSGANFALHFYAWRVKSLMPYWRDPECQFYFGILFILSLIIIFSLMAINQYPSNFDAIRYGLFETISIATTTGFATANFATWSPFIFTTLIIGSFMGGCAGSTGGGVKIIRILLMFKQGLREIARLIHPNSVITLKLGKKPVNDRVIEAVWGFIGIYIAIFVILLLMIFSTGIDFITGFSAVAASLNNLGPGLGDVALHYGDINVYAKWILCSAMLLGRLEIFTLLVLLTPMFWRR